MSGAIVWRQFNIHPLVLAWQNFNWSELEDNNYGDFFGSCEISIILLNTNEYRKSLMDDVIYFDHIYMILWLIASHRTV